MYRLKSRESRVQSPEPKAKGRKAKGIACPFGFFCFQKGATTLLKGLGNLANIGSLVKQAQEMSGKMQQLGEELKLERVTGSAGAGLVEVEANGLGMVLGVRIDPSLVEKQDLELMEDLLPAAINAAQEKAKQRHAEKMKQLTGGLDLSGVDLSSISDLLGGDK